MAFSGDKKNCMTNATFIVMGFLYLLAAIIVICLGLTSTSNALYIVAIVLLVLGTFFIIVGVAFCCFNRPATEAFACGNCDCLPEPKPKPSSSRKMSATKSHGSQHETTTYYRGETDEYTVGKRAPAAAFETDSGRGKGPPPGNFKDSCCDHGIGGQHHHFHREPEQKQFPLAKKHEQQLNSELEQLDELAGGGGAGDWNYNPGYNSDRVERKGPPPMTREHFGGPPDVPPQKNTSVFANPLHRSASGGQQQRDFGHHPQNYNYPHNGFEEDRSRPFPVEGGMPGSGYHRDQRAPSPPFQDHYEKDGRLTPRSQNRRQVQFANQQLVFGGGSAFSKPHPRGHHAASHANKDERAFDRYPRDDILNPVPTGISAMDGFPGYELPIPMVRAPSRQSLLEPTNFSDYSAREPEVYRGTPEPEGISPYGSLRRLNSRSQSQRSLTPGSLQRGSTPHRGAWNGPPVSPGSQQESSHSHNIMTSSREYAANNAGGRYLSPQNGYSGTAPGDVMTRSYQEHGSFGDSSRIMRQEHSTSTQQRQTWSSSAQNVRNKLEQSGAEPEYRITTAYDRSREDEQSYLNSAPPSRDYNDHRSAGSGRLDYSTRGSASQRELGGGGASPRPGYGGSATQANPSYATTQYQDDGSGRSSRGDWRSSATPNRDQRATTPTVPRARFPNVPWQTPFDEVRAAPPVPPVVNPLLEKVSRSRESSVAAQSYNTGAAGEQSTGALKAIYP